MKIHNIRLGLATNSSSTHSIIFLPPSSRAEEIVPDGDFGWDYWQLTSAANKLDYLSASLYSQISVELGHDIAMAVVKEWVGPPPQLTDYEDQAVRGVDHQSQLTFPRAWDGKGFDREFIEDFKKFVIRDDIMIAGGNDNDEGSPQALSAGGVEMGRPLPVEDYGSRWVARKDETYWVLFNRGTGAKLRITLDGPDTKAMPERSSAPELVDIKITDYCPFECKYCYQDSTKQGKHASYDWLMTLSWALGELKVFEVALGGGEPTLHDQFVDVVNTFSRSNIVVNFTTKNLGWLRDDSLRGEILENTGAFAFSVEKLAELKAFIKLCKRHKISTMDAYWGREAPKVVVQHVLGVAEPAEFQAILETCERACMPITLLGYKEVGRGPAFGRKSEASWLKIAAKVAKRGLRLGIDTALADRYWDDLINAEVPEYMMTRKEGQFSCYVDAVARTLNVSSYTTEPGLALPDYFDGHDFKRLYQELPR